MKKVICILCLELLLCLTACNIDNSPGGDNISSSQAGSPSSSGTHQVRGFPLDKLGLDCVDLGSRVVNGHDILGTNDMIRGMSYKGIDLLNTYGEYSEIQVKTSGSGLDVDSTVVLLVQGFLKEHLLPEDRRILIGENLYRPEALSDYKVYEDEDLIVFDLRPLITGVSLLDFLKAQNEDNVWMAEVYDLLIKLPNGFLIRTGDPSETLVMD